MTRRVVLVTAGHLASTPRIVKAADALHEAGYAVRVLSGESIPWTTDAGRALTKVRGWRWCPVYWRPEAERWRYRLTRLRHRAARGAAAAGPGQMPLGLLARAMARVAPELVRAAAAEPADLVYAGTSGGLAIGSLTARRLRVPYALDLEDFHPEEHSADGIQGRLVGAVERKVIPGAAFLTTSSEPIAAAYADRYQARPAVIHNVFPLPDRPPEFAAPVGRPLTLFWFSQVVGPGRGLEDAVAAAGRVRRPIRLRLLGQPDPAYLSQLRATAAASVEVEHLPPGPPDRIDAAAREADIGLALEPGFSRNNRLALSNKALTYLTAGLAVVMTDTDGQMELGRDLSGSAVIYRPGDIETLSSGLAAWADDPAALDRAKRASWEAARRRWHWEHPLERGVLLDAVAAAVGGP